MANPRILQVITHLALGGAERVCFTLMQQLGGEFDFAVFAVQGIDAGAVGQGMKREADAMRVPVYIGSKRLARRGGLLPAAWRLAKAARRWRADIIHLHTEIPESAYGVAAFLRPRTARIPLVRTIHNSVYWNPHRRLGCWCERRMARPCIAAVSQPALLAFEEVRAQSGMPPPPLPPRVLPNGVSVPDLPPRRRATGDPVRMLFAARFEPQKGADLLPAFVQQTQLPAGVRVELDIFGSGSFGASLQALSAAAPPGWKISISGPVAGLSARMNQYDLMLMPSRFEGLSVLAIESLMQGLPVVATRAPGLVDGLPADWPWLAVPGDAADYAQLLGRVLAEPDRWPAIADKGEAFAKQHFDVAAMARGYREIFNQSLAMAAER
jgi:glycosyltransferase involved in cell wall biosynthesis